MDRLERSVTADGKWRRQAGNLVVAFKLAERIENHMVQLEVFGHEKALDDVRAFALVDEHQPGVVGMGATLSQP